VKKKRKDGTYYILTIEVGGTRCLAKADTRSAKYGARCLAHISATNRKKKDEDNE
jgi:hypothetical protein